MRVDRMGRKISHHIRSNILGLVAIFIAFSGTAYATHPGGANTISTADIIDGGVNAVDIASGAVGTNEVGIDALTSADLAGNSVGSSELDSGSVFSTEVAFDTLTSIDLAGNSVNSQELAPDSVTSPEVATDAIGSSEIISNAVGSSEVAAGSLTTSDLAPGAPGKFTGAAFADPCDPGAAFLSCGAVSLSLPAAGSVLLQGSGGFMGTASGADTGTCQISEHPGTTAIGGNMTFGQAGSEHNSLERADGFALSALDTGNTAGLHTWTLLCNQTAGAVQVRDPKLSAIYLR